MPLLSQSQIDEFPRNGFLVIRGLVRGRELEALQQAARFVAEEGLAMKGHDHLYQQVADGSKVYWRSEKMWGRGDIFQAVTVHPTLLECIGQCIGYPFMPPRHWRKLVDAIPKKEKEQMSRLEQAVVRAGRN